MGKDETLDKYNLIIPNDAYDYGYVEIKSKTLNGLHEQYLMLHPQKNLVKKSVVRVDYSNCKHYSQVYIYLKTKTWD